VRCTFWWLLKSFMSLKGDFSKEERGPLAFFENSNEVQRLNAYPA